MDNKRFNKVMSEFDFALLKKGKQQGFRRAYLLYADLVYSLCFHLVGNEKASSALLETTFDTVLKKRASIHTPDTFAYWIRKCTINECMKYLKQQKNDDILFSNFLHPVNSTQKKYSQCQSSSNSILNTQPLLSSPVTQLCTEENLNNNAITANLDVIKNGLLHHRALKKMRYFLEQVRKS